MYLIYAKTIQAHIISLINEALRNIIYEVEFHFSEGGIHIKASNNSGNQLVHLFLDSSKFEKFECLKPLVVGIDITNFSKIMKSATKQEILTMCIEQGNPTELQIKLSNELSKISKNYSLRLIDLDEQNPPVFPEYSPKESFNIHIQTTKFKGICKSLSILSEQIEITCFDQELKLETVQLNNNSGIKANQTIDLTEDTNYCFSTKKSDSIFRGIFNLHTLLQFTRFSNLCTHVELILQNDLPLCIFYHCGQLGFIKLFLVSSAKKT